MDAFTEANQFCDALITARMAGDHDTAVDLITGHAVDNGWQGLIDAILSLLGSTVGMINALAELIDDDPLELWRRMALNMAADDLGLTP